MYGSNCWNEGEILFPAANLSDIPPSAPALGRGPFPLGGVGRASVAVQLLGRLAEKLLPQLAGKLEKSCFVLGCIQGVLMSWEGSAGLAKISLLLPPSLSPPEFQSHSTGINPREGSWMVTAKGSGCRAPGLGPCWEQQGQGGAGGGNHPEQPGMKTPELDPCLLHACPAPPSHLTPSG